MKSILFVIPTLKVAGAEKSLVSLLNEVDRTKYDITVLLISREGELLEKIPSDVKVEEMDWLSKAMLSPYKTAAPILKKNHKYLALFQRFIFAVSAALCKNQMPRSKDWDFVHKYVAPLDKEYDVAIGYLEGHADFYVAEKVKAKKKIAWVHSNYRSKKSNPERDEKYYGLFDNIVTISDQCADVLKEIYPRQREKICVIPNIVSSKEVIEKAESTTDLISWSKDAIHLLTVGRLETQKRIDRAIEACKILRDKGYDIVWHVLGEGSKRKELEDKIIECGLKDVFVLEGMKTNPYPYIKQAFCIVQSSDAEGKSIVLDEAKILRKLIVTTRYGSVEDQIQNETTGLVVDMDARSLAEGIIRLMNEPTLCKKISDNLNELNFVTEEIVKDIEELIEK